MPVIWITPQTYSQNGNIAAVVWAEDAATKTTTTAPLIGCVHQGTGNSCSGGQPSETVGYVAIDTANVDITSFQTGSADIAGSTWTAATFSPSFTNPRVMVTQNDDDGGQDPQYPWARNVVSGGMDFRYCEQDGSDYCDTHTGEVVNWFAMEDGDIKINGGGDIESAKDWQNYNDTFSSDWKNITEINITVYVSVYNSSGSTQKGNNNPDLQLEMYNGSDFVGVGNFSVNGVGNFTLTVSDATVRAGWQTPANTDLRIRGIDFDYNGSSNFDDINWTGLWIGINGARWTEIGNHSEPATLSWNTTALPDQTCVDLRSRAIDLTGSNTYSNYYTKGACLNISHATLEIIDITLSSAPIDFGSLNPGVSLQSALAGSGYPLVVTIESITNVDTNLTLMGTNFTSASFEFEAGNLSYSNATTDVKTEMALNYTALPPYSNWINIPGPKGGPALNRSIYFWITIPPGQEAGIYSSTVTVKAEA
ncbi:hypothetical protein BMS3Bbin16_00672 [archaeon BMS3Bbin16]|nr:hypothetical protein BMS3Bbin16_00672 [archaeon BMS3Bbin16]